MPAPDLNSLNESLRSIATLNERTVQLMEAQVRASERLNRASKDTGRELDGWHTEMRTLLRDTAEIQQAMERIKKLQKAQVAEGSGRSGTLNYVRQVKQEYAYLMKTLTAGQHNKKYVKDVNKLLTDMSNIMKGIEKRSDATWDSSSEGLQEINRQLREANKGVMALKQNIDRVKVDRMSTSFKRLGATIDDAFSGDASRFMRQIPGVSGFLNVKRFGNRAAAAKENIEAFNRRRIERRQAAARGNAQLFADKFGPAGVRAFRKMGYAGESPLPKYHRVVKAPAAGGSSGGEGSAASTKKPGGAFLWDASGTGKIALGGGASPSAPGRRTVTVPPGLLNRSKWGLGKVAPEELTGALDEGAASSAFSRWALNQAKGTGAFKGIAESLLTKGGGSAAAGLEESVVGASSGIMSGAFGMAAKAAPWVAVAKGAMDVIDRVAMEHAKIQEVLGPYGARGSGNAHDEFSAVRNSLLSMELSKAMFLGQGLKENMDIMRVLGEGGYAPGSDLRSGKVNLERNLDQISGVEGRGFYGAIMKNAVYNGKNLGMNQESSVRLTLKLMDKFGLTAAATQDFFRDLDTMMEASGVSASKYIEIADGITDQFDDMNKSLSNTMTLLNSLGKTSRFTGKQMEDMIKTIEAKNEMTPAQMIVNAQAMIRSGEAGKLAASQTASSEAALAELKTSLDEAGITIGEGGILANVDDIAFQISRSNLPQQGKNNLSSSLSFIANLANAQRTRAAALNSKDPSRVAGAYMSMKTSGIDNAYIKEASLRNIASSLHLSEETINGLMQGDPEAIKKLFSGDKSLALGLINKDGVFQGEFDIVDYLNQRRDLTAAGATNLVSLAKPGVTPELLREGKFGGMNAYNAMLRAQRAREKAGKYVFKKGPNAERDAVDDFIRQGQDQEGARELVRQLQKNDDTFHQMLDENSPLAKALKTTMDQVQADIKAKQTISATRTMADTFADSFEYLFNRLVLVLDKIARFVDKTAWDRENLLVNNPVHRAKVEEIKGLYYGVDPGKLTEVQKTRYTRIGKNIASKAYMDASGGPELLAKDLQDMKDMAMPKEALDENKRLFGQNAASYIGGKWNATKNTPENLYAATTGQEGMAREIVRMATGSTPQEQWESIKRLTDTMQASGDISISSRGGLIGNTSRGNTFLNKLFDSIGDPQNFKRTVGNTGNVTINQFYSTPVVANPYTSGQAAQSPQAPSVKSTAGGRNTVE